MEAVPAIGATGMGTIHESDQKGEVREEQYSAGIEERKKKKRSLHGAGVDRS